MTTDLENQLTAGMREQVAGITLTSDILGAAQRHHQHRAVLHRTAYAAGVVGLAGALAAVAAVAGTGHRPVIPGRPPVAATEPANVRLAAAVAASQAVSYKVKLTAETKGQPGSRQTTEGAVDPATSTGYLNTPLLGTSTVYYQRLIHGVLYLGSTGGTLWKQEKSDGRLRYSAALPGVLEPSADPNQLFDELRQLKATITQTGPRTYHFRSVRPYHDRYSDGTATLTGDVTLDAGKRIARVAYESSDKGRLKPGVKGGGAYGSTEVITMELSAYGTPVHVERPAPVVVAR